MQLEIGITEKKIPHRNAPLPIHKKMKATLETDVLLDFRNQFICGDALEIMRQMPDESLDLVVTSAPYNLKNSTGSGMKDGRGVCDM